MKTDITSLLEIAGVNMESAPAKKLIKEMSQDYHANPGSNQTSFREDFSGISREVADKLRNRVNWQGSGGYKHAVKELDLILNFIRAQVTRQLDEIPDHMRNQRDPNNMD